MCDLDAYYTPGFQFNKTEADLDYMSKKLDAEFANAEKGDVSYLSVAKPASGILVLKMKELSLMTI